MTILKRWLHVLDSWQRRNRVAGVTYAVIKKFGDDQANLLVVALGWYGFTAIFPLLLVAVTILGFIGADGLGRDIIDSLQKFPIIGSSFSPGNGGSNLKGSLLGLVIGVAGLLYGAQGVTQTAQQAMGEVWNVPRIQRPGFLVRLGRSLLGLAIIAGAFALNAVLGSIAAGYGSGLLIGIGLIGGLLVVNIGCYFAAFVVLTPPKTAKPRRFLPGAIVGAVGFTFLTTLGTGLVQHQLPNTQATYGAFAGIIGVVAYLLLLAKLTVYAAELNPVLALHLWPRALPTAEPTEADDRVLHQLALEERARPDERIGVGFGSDSAEEAGRDARHSGDTRKRGGTWNENGDSTDWSRRPSPGVPARRR